MTKCVVCGVEGNFAGYHSVGPERVSLCVACAEDKVPVYVLRPSCQDKGGVYSLEVADVIDQLESELEESEVGASYTVTTELMQRLKFYALPEFEGF